MQTTRTRTTTHFAGVFSVEIVLDLDTKVTRFCAKFAAMPGANEHESMFFAAHPSLASAAVRGTMRRNVLHRSEWIATIETVNGVAVDPDADLRGGGPIQWMAVQSAIGTLAHDTARIQRA